MAEKTKDKSIKIKVKSQKSFNRKVRKVGAKITKVEY